jgi:hypothetical protein
MPKYLIEATELVRFEGYVEAETEAEAVTKFMGILTVEDKPDLFIEDLYNDSDGLEIQTVIEVPEEGDEEVGLAYGVGGSPYTGDEDTQRY